jgi:Protein of unknown function (DUF2510)
VLGVLTVGAALGTVLMARTPLGHTDSRGMLMMSFASMFFMGLVAMTVALIMASQGASHNRRTHPVARHLPSAGWYPDPNGRQGLRYWDGSQWTEGQG